MGSADETRVKRKAPLVLLGLHVHSSALERCPSKGGEGGQGVLKDRDHGIPKWTRSPSLCARCLGLLFPPPLPVGFEELGTRHWDPGHGRADRGEADGALGRSILRRSGLSRTRMAREGVLSRARAASIQGQARRREDVQPRLHV